MREQCNPKYNILRNFDHMTSALFTSFQSLFTWWFTTHFKPCDITSWDGKIERRL